MSHVSKIEMEFRDLATLRKVCERLGLEFMEGQTTYRWYGRTVGPGAGLPEGFSEADLGRCEHAIRVNGADYQVGVVQRNNRYHLLCDWWDKKLAAKLGESGGLIKQAYAAERVRQEARRRKMRVKETVENGSIRIRLFA